MMTEHMRLYDRTCGKEKEMQQKEFDKVLGKTPVELVLKNGRLLNVYNGAVEKTDIAIDAGRIVGIGRGYHGEKSVDLEGRYVAPGFIDGHVHIESSMMTPTGFAEAVLVHGTTTVVADPHEIANVCGLEGIRYMLESAKQSALDVYIMLPSCVPSTEFEQAGACLLAEDLLTLIDDENVVGLGEMMNYPGVLNEEDTVMDKLHAFDKKRIDGHAPGLSGKNLNAYIYSGITTDHECVTPEEMMEKIGKGMYVHLREGSATRNVRELSKGITASNNRWLMLCTDDKHPTDILDEGHINYNMRLLSQENVPFMTSLQMATINSATCYGLRHKGAIAPGYDADLVILSNIEEWKVDDVYKKGRQVVKSGELVEHTKPYIDPKVEGTIHVAPTTAESFTMPLKSDVVHVIQLIKNQILTRNVTRKVDIERGLFKHNNKLDILKLAVVERHAQSNRIGRGLVEGFGLKGGAIALSIAHDSRNIIVVGDSDEAMSNAVNAIIENQGGIAIASPESIMGVLQLEVAGLMTNAPYKEVVETMRHLEQLAKRMGVPNGIDPFMTLAFLALPVIPELKVTDQGLFDVKTFSFIPLEA